MASVTKVLKLNSMGFGLQESKIALEKCNNDVNSAKNYLLLKGDAVCRYKIVRGKKIRWTDEDFIKYATTGAL